MDKPKPRNAALIVQAGAWRIPDAEKDAHRAGVRAAIEAGWAVLAAGGGATAAVVQAIETMEDDPALNAGRGSVLAGDGHVELDAGLMEGLDMQVGAVTGLRRVANPIRAADLVRGSRHVFLSGAGAEAWLQGRGVALVDAKTLVLARERERLTARQAASDAEGPGGEYGPLPSDTVGAVAVDHAGNIASGASTGGMCGKPPGRIGDAPVPGAGYYADNLAAGAACSGWGEAVVRHGTARRAVELAREHNAVDACWLAIRELEERFGGKGGIVLIGRDSTIGYGFNTPSMAFAYRDTEMKEPLVGGIAPDR